MGNAAYYAFIYSLTSVLVFGILGNILVIISITRQKQLLKKNYYFLVLNLAVCDLGTSVFLLLAHIIDLLGLTSYPCFSIEYIFRELHYPFYLSGVAMMLIISVFRYRATVHPFKPAISRGKLIKVCCVVYVVNLIIGLGSHVPYCFDVRENYPIYWRFLVGFDVLYYLVPTIFMIACYCKIGRALVKQNKQIKRMGSAAVRNRHNRDRRIFLVCLCTVVCFVVGRLVFSVWFIWLLAGKDSLLSKYFWVDYTGYILLVAGTVSANALIYGILDKRMFRFLKLCKKKRQTPEELAFQQM